MRKVWLIADAIVTPLGTTSAENYNEVAAGKRSVRSQAGPGGTTDCISLMAGLNPVEDATRFETMCQRALRNLADQVGIPKSKTAFILSTTKGNIELLEAERPQDQRIHLHVAAQKLAGEIGIGNSTVVSNACTSGVVALLLAKRFIEQSTYDHAVVLGADTVNRFVLSGFQSLNALSPDPCRPFDASRTGINLGEAASAILLSAKPEGFDAKASVTIRGGGISNDANHISGPSKTGEELAAAIQAALREADVGKEEIDFISAHGTATLFNDEMEAKAFHRADLGNVLLNSLKGSFGHTLGAAGVIETVLSAASLRNQELLPSVGFEKIGVSQNLNVIRKREPRPLRFALKTASGFGGCNAALVLSLE